MYNGLMNLEINEYENIINSSLITCKNTWKNRGQCILQHSFVHNALFCLYIYIYVYILLYIIALYALYFVFKMLARVFYLLFYLHYDDILTITKTGKRF